MTLFPSPWGGNLVLRCLSNIGKWIDFGYESVLCLIVSIVKLKGCWFLNYVWVSEFSLVVLHNQCNVFFLSFLCLFWLTCAVLSLFLFLFFCFQNNVSCFMNMSVCMDLGCRKMLEIAGRREKLDSEGLKKLSVFRVCLNKLLHKHF